MKKFIFGLIFGLILGSIPEYVAMDYKLQEQKINTFCHGIIQFQKGIEIGRELQKSEKAWEELGTIIGEPFKELGEALNEATR